MPSNNCWSQPADDQSGAPLHTVDFVDRLAWHAQSAGIIAINYAAKAKGVTRHMRVAEARAKCPELRFVHVQTIGSGQAHGQELAC